MGKPLVFHPGPVDESIFAGSTVPFLAAEFFLGHIDFGLKELAKKLPKNPTKGEKLVPEIKIPLTFCSQGDLIVWCLIELIDSSDFGTQGIEALVDVLVAAVDLLDVVDD